MPQTVVTTVGESFTARLRVNCSGSVGGSSAEAALLGEASRRADDALSRAAAQLAAADKLVLGNWPCVPALKRELTLEQLLADDRCLPDSLVVPPLAHDDFLTPESCSALRLRPPAHSGPRALFLVIAFQQPALLARLLRRLQAEDGRHAILVHTDRRASADFMREITSLAAALEPPACVAHSHAIVYSTGTEVEVLMAAMAHFVHTWADSGWDYFIPLSGQDYPLLAPAAMLERLGAAAGRSYMRAGRGHAACRSAAQLRDGGEARWRDEFDVRACTYNAPCLPPQPSALSGAANVPVRPRAPWLWAQLPDLQFCWTRPMASGVYGADASRFLVRDRRARRAFYFFRRLGLAQSEHFFSSALGSWYDNGTNLLDIDPVVMSWTRGSTRGRRRGDISNTFLTSDEAELISAGRASGALFARKFHLEVDAAVLDLIDAGLPGHDRPSEAMLAEAAALMTEHADGDDVRRWHSAEHVTFPVYVSEGQG